MCNLYSDLTAPDWIKVHIGIAAADQSDAFDTMLREPEVNRLFNDGALYFERRET